MSSHVVDRLTHQGGTVTALDGDVLPRRHGETVASGRCDKASLFGRGKGNGRAGRKTRAERRDSAAGRRRWRVRCMRVCMSPIRAAEPTRDRRHIDKEKRRAVVEFLGCAPHGSTIEPSFGTQTQLPNNLTSRVRRSARLRQTLMPTRAGQSAHVPSRPAGIQTVQSRITLPLSPDSIAAKPFS